MKSSLVLLSLCSVLLLGGLALWLLSGREAPSSHSAATAPAAPSSPVQPATGDSRSDEVLARVDALAHEVDQLRAQVAALETGAAREPAAEVAAEKPLDEPAAAFAALHRDGILKVIEEDRQEQKRKQEEEQRARDLQADLARAERTAKQFGLAGDQQKQLADVFILERQKMDDLRNQTRGQGGPGGDPQARHQGFRDLREWRLNELTNRFGADLAEKIDAADSQRFGGGVGQGGRRGNRGQRGQNNAGGSDGGNGSGGGL